MGVETKRGGGVVREQRNGRPYLAFVDVAVTIPGDRQVELGCGGDGFTSQGRLEEVSENGYEHWKSGAQLGASFAMRAVGTDVSVTIERIAGMHTDTTPSMVALAAARAVWNVLGTQPSSDALARIESEAFTSWARDPDAAPDLPEL